MPAIVVPFRGARGKQRLNPLPDDVREELSLAMLADVLAACTTVGRTVVVTSDDRGGDVAGQHGAEVVEDPGVGSRRGASQRRRPRARRQRRRPVRRPVRPAPARRGDTGRRARVRRRARRHDERARPQRAAVVRAALRRAQRRAVPPARAYARRRVRARCYPESRGRRRLDRRPRSPSAARRPADARGATAVKIVALSGGVGGARFLRGLVDVVDERDLTVVGNVGDDVEILGLHVSPDLDSILYTLAGLGDEERGWGRADETWNALESVAALGGEDWFRLGDRDLGLHLVRTAALRAGEPLSSATARLSERLGLAVRLLPATDDRLRTWIDTDAGTFSFQEWFVRRGHRDDALGVRYAGAEAAAPAPGVVDALGHADLVLLA